MKQPTRLANVKQVIAIASSKGGVGKSTTAVNLALALQKTGARVGLLDADIYGPSQPLMLGVPEDSRPELDGELFVPIIAHGLQTMSMGYLVTDKTPMIWRGPIVSGTLQKLLLYTKWDNLDYLVIDMPPGTGDIQLTLAQTVVIDGAVLVSIPNDIALLEVKKAIEMFKKVNIPLLGLVENMAAYTCTNCGHKEDIFGNKTSDAISTDYKLDVLGSLPLHAQMGHATERPPITIDLPESKNSLIYQRIAKRIVTGLQAMHG